MRSPILRHPKLRSVLALAVAAAFQACGASDGPFEPARESLTDSSPESTASQAVPTGGLAALTSQRIAFSSCSPTSCVYMMDPQGGQRDPLFTQSAGAWSPAWSWDNTHVAMVSPRTSNGVVRTDILVMNADGTNQHWARSQASVWHFADPSWAPSGSRIVMTVFVAGVPTLGWMEPATGKVGLFYFPGGGAIKGTRPSFNKAGTKILYVGEHYNTIEQINPDGSGHKVRISSSAMLDYPSFSPDGSRIAYEKGPATGNRDIFVKNLATGVTSRLTWSTAKDSHASWSPDGVRIAFMSERTGKRQIYTMKSATGGDVQRISSQSYVPEDEPAWTH